MTFIYLEMPKFNKTVENLESRFDKWMYVLRNLSKLERIPNQLREQIFEKLFEVAEIAGFSRKEAEAYEDSPKSYRDLKNSLDTAREEGLKEGLDKGMKKGLKKGMENEKKMIVRNSLKAGLNPDVISNITGLSQDEIKRIRDEV